MARLPGGDRAFIPPGKIAGYCLSPDHGEGRHKARVFASALGLTATDEELLAAALLAAARTENAELLLTDGLGARYRVDFRFDHNGRTAVIRSGWMVSAPGRAPYLTTAFVLLRADGKRA